jgi:hypothetical protein
VGRGERGIPNGVAGGSDTAITLPLSNPQIAMSLAITGSPCRAGSTAAPAARPTTVPCRWASRPRNRPSTERSTTTCSPIAGADSSSELTCVRHSSVPWRRRARSPSPCSSRPRPCRGGGRTRRQRQLQILLPHLMAGIQRNGDHLALVRGREHGLVVDAGPKPSRSTICFLPPPTPSPHSSLTGSVCGKSTSYAGGSTSLSLLQPATIIKAARPRGSKQRIRVWPCSFVTDGARPPRRDRRFSIPATRHRRRESLALSAADIRPRAARVLLREQRIAAHLVIARRERARNRRRRSVWIASSGLP